MELLPAIDLRHGQVVRLRQGDAARATAYGADPLAVAAGFAAAGVRRIHVVDLDAALGEPPQRELVARLAALLASGSAAWPAGSGEIRTGRGARDSANGAGDAASETENSATGARDATSGAGNAASVARDPARGAPIGLQLGGGLRDRAAVEWALAAGCERVVLGSLPARDPAAFAELARAFPGRLVPAVEVAGGEPRVAGWTRPAGSGLDALCRGLRGLPCPAALVTDVERDGMLSGPNLELARRVAAATGLPALLSGGVGTLADLEAAAGVPEITGVVLGRALYEGRIDLGAALAVCAGAAVPHTAGAGRSTVGASPPAEADGSLATPGAELRREAGR
jgi:phosphoribosylformimino-5-aminoimidazole carboxamide ribonucleotide (ProFAR) isomerase